MKVEKLQVGQKVNILYIDNNAQENFVKSLNCVGMSTNTIGFVQDTTNKNYIIEKTDIKFIEETK